MAEMNIWKENKIPPLEYCSLCRAAELLSCYIEDIMHWFICGDIWLSASITDIYGCMDMEITENDDLEYIFNNFPLSSFSYFNALSPVRYQNKNIENQMVNIGGGISGIWKFKVWDCDQSQDYFYINERSTIIPLIDSVMDEDINITFRVTQGRAKIKIDDLLIDRRTIEILHYCAINGLRICEVDEYEEFNGSNNLIGVENLDSCDKNEKNAITINDKKQHGNSERHQKNRESLYKSAIYILSKYPNECRGDRKEISPEKWKDAIKTHQKEIPPLQINNDDVILRHLRNAVNLKMYGAEQ